jgi:hypothetical protein
MRTLFEVWQAKRLERKFWKLWAKLLPAEAQLHIHMRAKGQQTLDPWSLTMAPTFTGSEILDDYNRFPRLDEIAGCLKLSPNERREMAQHTCDTYGPVEDRIRGHQYLEH